MDKKKIYTLLPLPSLIGFLALYVVPFFYSFFYAFTENAFTKKFVGFDNFASVIKNEFFSLAMLNTAKFTIVSVATSMPLSLFVALLIARFAARLSWASAAFFIPYFYRPRQL